MKETVINLYPILQFIIILFALFGGYSLVKDIINTISRSFKDKLDNAKDIQAKQKDTEILNNLIARYPLVDKNFMLKSEVEQNIENIQEIHEINKKIEKLEELVEKVIENANRS